MAGTTHTASVAADFEPRIRAWEDEHLSGVATRSYPAIRERPEEDCSLRTPFQRDRDRIVHSKAFRRLKHKTQVFVAPQGDHYRTRLTHTLEVTQVSRTVARALRLNEDLAEAIGLGHDLGHPPFGHIGEAALDACLSERFGTGFRHFEHSLRVVDVIERLNLNEAVRDGIVHHSGRAPEPATQEGAIVRLVDRIAYINHDIDDALRAGVIAPGDLPAREIEVLGDSGSRRIDTLVHDLVEHSARAGQIVQGEEVGDAMARLRAFMFERVYMGEEARREHARIDTILRALFDHYVEHPPPGVEGATIPERVTDRIAGMTDRFSIREFEALAVPAVVRLMARYTPDSKERVRDAVDMIDLVSARTELRRAGANRYEGLCPFHEERTPSFGIDPVKKVYHCFGCGAGGDVFTFVQETEGLDFGGAMELLADRYAIELEREQEDPQAAARRERRERLIALLERTAAYYARYLWESAEAGDARVYLAGRGLLEETLRRFRVGYAPKPWDHMVKRWRLGGYSEEELVAAGLAKRGRQRAGIYDPFRGRLTFPLCDLRGRVLGFAGRGLRDDQRPKYLNSPEGELFHKGQQLFGGDLARPATAKAQEVVLVEGYTDVLALHQAGIDNAVGMMGTALTERQVGEVARLVGPGGVLHIALDADASGQEAMLRAAELAAARDLRLDVVVLPGSSDPAELLAQEGVDAMRARIDDAVPLATFRVKRVFATADLDGTEGRNRAYEALRAVLGALPPSPEREDLVRMAASKLGLSEQLAGLLTVPVRRESGEAPSPSRIPLDRREQSERAFLALCVALPEKGREALRGMDPATYFTSAVVRRAAEHLRDHITNPTDDLSADDADLVSLVTELVLRAAGEPADPDTLRLETLQLEKARLEREILAATADGRAEVSDLAAQKKTLQREIDSVMAGR